MFAFSIYDKNQDGLISCKEINELFDSLSEKLIYLQRMLNVTKTQPYKRVHSKYIWKASQKTRWNRLFYVQRFNS
jgi:hypothetical protein